MVLRISTSISPDCRAVNRASAVSGMKLTALASPSTAAATTRQKSMSNPANSPASSTMPNPGRVSLPPQLRAPRSWTAARVPPPWVSSTVLSPSSLSPPSSPSSVCDSSLESPSPPESSSASSDPQADATSTRASSSASRRQRLLAFTLGTSPFPAAARRSLDPGTIYGCVGDRGYTPVQTTVGAPSFLRMSAAVEHRSAPACGQPDLAARSGRRVTSVPTGHGAGAAPSMHATVGNLGEILWEQLVLRSRLPPQCGCDSLRNRLLREREECRRKHSSRTDMCSKRSSVIQGHLANYRKNHDHHLA